MNLIKEMPKKTKKEFSPKDAIIEFSSFTMVCLSVILFLVVNDILTECFYPPLAQV